KPAHGPPHVRHPLAPSRSRARLPAGDPWPRVDQDDDRHLCAYRHHRRRPGDARPRAGGVRMTAKKITDPFSLGGIAAIEMLEVELIRNRDLIEADPQPTVDVVIDLIHRIVDEIQSDARSRKA